MKAQENFIYSAEKSEYTIKLKQKKYWWLLWFLLLLLPLLLLLEFEKDVKFKLVDDLKQNAITRTKVQFSYTEYKLFQNSKPVILSDSSDNNGVVLFQKIKYTLYSQLFCSNTKAFVVASSDCFKADSLSLNFHDLKDKQEILIKLPVKGYDLEIKVIDKDDNQPIPSAKVHIRTKLFDIEKTWDDSTNVDGVVIIKNAPYCGNLSVIASKYGYQSDSLTNEVKKLTGDISSRTLKLKPIKAMVKILVKDLFTKQVLPGAVATLKIDSKTVSVLRTNTNGVGVGVFDSVKITAKAVILVQKPFYNDTSKQIVIAEFIKQNDENRTFYLRPNKQTVIFRDIDAKTGQPVVGAKNEITVNGVLRTEAEFSNSEGVFVISGVFVDDKISITASKTGYSTNNTTIQNKKFSELIAAQQNTRDIPLNQNPPPPPPPDDLKGKTGNLKINLQWKTLDDLDLFVTDPCGNTIWALELKQTCNGNTGIQDLDANTNRFSKTLWTRNAQENTYWETASKGVYTISVEHCNKQDNQRRDPVEFNITIIDRGVRRDVKGSIRTKEKKVITTHEVK